MTLSRMTAIALLLVATLLAFVGYGMLTSGEPYLRLVGLIAAGGAVVMLLFSAGLFLRKPVTEEGASSGYGDTLRRLIFLGVALYALGVPLYAVAVSGKIPTLSLDSKRMISLKAEPQSFWLMAGLHAVPGVYCLFMALRRRR